MTIYVNDKNVDVRNIDLTCDNLRFELAASYFGDDSNDVEIEFDDRKDIVEFAKFVTYFAQQVERNDID